MQYDKKTLYQLLATARVNTLSLTPSTSANASAQAVIVAPVVSTSSTKSTCLPANRALSTA